MPVNKPPLFTLTTVATSISKAQAAALADDFLGNLGSEKGSLQPVETVSEVVLIASDMALEMQDNLNQTNSIATGALSESIAILDPVSNGTEMQVDIEMNFYGLFVNKGVKGTKSSAKAPQSPYRFKTDFPSKNMVDAIKAWIKEGKMKSKAKDVKKYGTYGKHETKAKSISEIGIAYAVARSIKMMGLKATGFLDKAVATTSATVEERLGQAFRIDVINSIDPK